MTPSEKSKGRRIAQWLLGWRLGCLVCVALFLGGVMQFYDSATGFTSLISIGSKLGDSKVSALKAVPHYVYEESYGYDGSYYVQLALHPLLDDPELKGAIDNLQYRAKRILLSWVAWALGAGQPRWIVQVYSLLNVFSWLGLAWLLWRWFPPDSFNNFLRWAGVMFSHGVCMSVRHSLVDGPSLLLVATAVALIEDGRRNAGTAMLAVATLGKETSVLAMPAMLRTPIEGRQPWINLAGRLVLIVLPLALWMGYVRLRVGPAHESGLNNFTLPLTGFFDKWFQLLGDLGADGFSWPRTINLQSATLLAMIGLTVQFFFVILRREPAAIWWRVGAPFAGLMAMVSEPVWEGLPGAATRVVLPLTLAFNVLVPRGRRWLPVLLAGNLSVVTSLFEFTPPREFFRLTGPGAAVTQLQVEPRNWYSTEFNWEHHWRWSQGKSSLMLVNRGPGELEVRLVGRANSVTPRQVSISLDGQPVWHGAIDPQAIKLILGPFRLSAGPHALAFASDQSETSTSAADPRNLAFAVADLEVAVTFGTAHSNP
jgi:hypothetical protein